MKRDFQYHSGARTFSPGFGRVINATDGGYDRGYEAGAGTWAYVQNLSSTFSGVAFPDNTELVLPVQRLKTISYVIYQATGLSKLTLKGQTDGPVSGSYLFMNSVIPELDFSELNGGVLTFASGVKYAFQDCVRLKYIRGALNLENVKSTTGTLNMFRSCSQLVEVRFTRGSVFVDLSLSSCANLSDASIGSIIDGLADLSGKTPQTLTLHANVRARLTLIQKQVIAAKNWSVVS